MGEKCVCVGGGGGGGGLPVSANTPRCMLASSGLTCVIFFSVVLRPQTLRSIRDEEPRTSTSTFTQLLALIRVRLSF